ERQGGQADQDQEDSEVEDQRTLGPLQGDDHVVETVRVFGVLGVVDAFGGHIPAVQVSGHFHPGPYLVVVTPGEDQTRDFIGPVRVEWPVTRVTVRLDRGADLSRRFSLGVLQVSQVGLGIQAYGGVGGQYVGVLVDQRVLGINENIHRQTVRDGLQLL